MSSTMIAANTTGIPVFVTGGIGGVHRAAQSSEFLSNCCQNDIGLQLIQSKVGLDLSH